MTRVEKIGAATLYLGDCREILPTLGAVESLVTDPPYGMAFRSNYRIERHAEIAGDNSDDCLRFACDLQAQHSSYIFCRWDNLASVRRPKSVVTWVKNNWSMGDLEHEHARQSEIILFYPGPAHVFPSYRPTDIVSAPRTGNENHPSEKPTMLMAAIVGWTTGIVCDPFMGSGSTGVACAKVSRSFIGIEVHEPYFNMACRRIEQAARQQDLFAA